MSEALALVNAYLVCNTKSQRQDSRMVHVTGHAIAVVAKRLWLSAILTAVGAVGVTSQAGAALYYWPNSDPGVSLPAPTVPQRRPRPRLGAGKKPEIAERRPQGPLIISISIAQQRMKIYDANGYFAETPVSTGMPGHSTPMGVFSVIQKHKFHHSNIYSGAPMPYMQRITWSGVAMHAGVLPGRPASHGCIRMPMAFAVKMWNWTKMGARVVITPGEITPSSFSHPLLATLKVPPQPIAVDEPKLNASTAAKADKAADTDANAIAETRVELRSPLGHENNAKPAADETRAFAPPQRRTADASTTGANPSATMSDAATAGGSALVSERAISDKAGDSSSTELAKSKAERDDAEHDEIASSDDKSADDNPAEAKSSEAGGEAAKVEAAANETNKADVAKVKAKADDLHAEPSKADVTKAGDRASDKPSDKAAEKPDESVTAVAAPAALPEPNRDQTRPIEVLKQAAPKAEPAPVSKRAGQIAVLVSRKDAKLYVRQNLAPLFDVPVTIAPSDRPLGTHVFTAKVDKNDANVLHWSVVSLPAPIRYADRRDEDERNSRRRRIAGAGPMELKRLPVQDSPAEALDRLTLPADAMARIAEALSTGGSIIVSDQGVTAGETGEGTDFIVSLR
jgi:lipoprotein-anchoring transpeptidase ErfK/SrfK